MTKVLIYIALHRRRELAETYYPALRRFMDAGIDRGVTIWPLFIFSEWDDMKLAQRWFPDNIYVEADNYPLGAKFNAGLPYAFRLPFDYLMQLGCDDILLPEYWDAVLPYLQRRDGIIGMTSLYCYDLGSDRMKLTGPTQFVFGAGRFIRRDLVELGADRYRVRCLQTDTGGNRKGEVIEVPVANYNEKVHEFIEPCYALWTPDKMNALDGNSFMRIVEATGGQVISNIAIPDIYCLDIKTADNINAFDKMPGTLIAGEQMESIKQRFGI